MTELSVDRRLDIAVAILVSQVDSKWFKGMKKDEKRRRILAAVTGIPYEEITAFIEGAFILEESEAKAT